METSKSVPDNFCLDGSKVMNDGSSNFSEFLENNPTDVKEEDGECTDYGGPNFKERTSEEN